MIFTPEQEERIRELIRSEEERSIERHYMPGGFSNRLKLLAIEADADHSFALN